MAGPSLLRDFRHARPAGKLRYVFWSLLWVATAAATVWVVVGIIRLHFLIGPGNDAAEDQLAALQKRAELSAEASRSTAATKRATDDKPPEAPAFAFPYEIKSVAVPIANHTLNKAIYMQFTILYDCPNQGAVEVLQMSRARLRSMLYETALQFNEDDFRTPEGFDKFRNELLVTLKAAFGENAPRTVALKDVLVN